MDLRLRYFLHSLRISIVDSKLLVFLSFNFTALFILSSCNSALKTYYGFHDPCVENSETIQKYVFQKKINADNIAVTASEIKFRQVFKKNSKIPEIRVFGKDGNGFHYKDEHLCNAQAFDFTKRICSANELERDTSVNLASEINGLVDLNGRPLTINDFKGYDFIVFIYWAKFIGRLNKDHVKVWEDNLNAQNGCGIKVIKVNLDLQKNWIQ